jgi:hypothetical protein
MLFRGPLGGGAASGKSGSVVASHNRGGQYLRARTTPTNPNTARQQAIRSALGSQIQAYTLVLTPTQRAGWETYAANTPARNRLGDTIHLTGQNMFARYNIPATQVAAVFGGGGPGNVNDAPTTYNTGEPITSVADGGGIVGQLTYSTTPTPQLTASFTLNTPASENGSVFLFIGRPQNSSRAFYKGPYQLATIINVADGDNNVPLAVDPTDPLTWASATAPAVGQFLPIRATIGYIDGRYSQAFEIIAPVVAPGP